MGSDEDHNSGRHEVRGMFRLQAPSIHHHTGHLAIERFIYLGKQEKSAQGVLAIAFSMEA